MPDIGAYTVYGTGADAGTGRWDRAPQDSEQNSWYLGAGTCRRFQIRCRLSLVAANIWVEPLRVAGLLEPVRLAATRTTRFVNSVPLHSCCFTFGCTACRGQLCGVPPRLYKLRTNRKFLGRILLFLPRCGISNRRFPPPAAPALYSAVRFKL